MDKKPYLIEGVVGNSRLLASLGKKGQLYRMFWPNIDFPQHVNFHQAGVILPNKNNHILWLNEDCWEISQKYLDRTNILETTYRHHDHGVKITCRDFAPKGEDLLIRFYELENIGDAATEVNFLYYSDFHIAESERYHSTIFDRDHQSMVHFRNDFAFAVASKEKVSAFQCGHSWNAAQYGNLNNQDVCPLSDGCLKWNLGVISPREKVSLPIYIGCGRSIDEALWNLKKGIGVGAESFIEKTKKYWHDFLDRGTKFEIKDPLTREVYERSLLVMALMQDEQYGGIIAAPEFDEKFSRCGGYGFCWGRDAAFITTAFDEAGYYPEVQNFYRWAIKAQSDSGAWLQRHYMNGNLAPTWGMQIDETASIIWGVWQHFKNSQDLKFLKEFWPHMVKGANFLTSYINPDKELPDGSYDLWEERFGIHSYSTAAVIAGLMASYEAGETLEWLAEEGKRAARKREGQGWKETAEKMKEALLDLWRPSLNRFVRTLNGNVYQYEDHEIDISLLGVSIPFGVFEPRDEKVVKMAKVLEEHLTSHKGGIKRYVHDQYIGGNPWVLCTLWLAQYYVATKEFAKAKNLLRWTIEHRTKLSLLPEQVDKESGQPAWVIPLTWSHAMYILTVIELAKAGEI